MKRFTTYTAACALMAAASTAAYADCAADLAEMTGGSDAAAHEGISKDGTLAPLQTQGTGTDMTSGSQGQDAGSASSDGEVAKDGSGVPLNGSGMGEGTAMSGQDAQAQQRGEATTGGATTGDAAMGDATTGNTTMGDATAGNTATGDAAMGNTATGDATMGNTTMGDAPMADGSSERDALIDEARTALENGDEAACQDAVDRAANL